MRVRASQSLVPHSSASRPLEGARVLIVDDDLDSRDAMVSVLLLEGVVTLEAATASAARMLCHGVDLIVSDIDMPGESGNDLIHSIRELLPDNRIPALAISGGDSALERARALAAGFDAFLPKPF